MILDNPVAQAVIRPTSAGRKVGSFRVTQDFGPTSVKAEPRIKWPGGEGIPARTYPHFHRGLDLGNGRCGGRVLAAADGRVAFAGISSSGSRTVIIDHGDLRTWYAHLADDGVAKGDRVKAGALIGHVGATGNAIGCHLHFALEDHGEWLDPWPRLRQNVTVHPVLDETVNLRTAPDLTAASRYAQSEAGRIVRLSDNAVIAGSADPLPWLGTVPGADYGPSNKWERARVDGRTLVIASEYAVLSAK